MWLNLTAGVAEQWVFHEQSEANEDNRFDVEHFVETQLCTLISPRIISSASRVAAHDILHIPRAWIWWDSCIDNFAHHSATSVWEFLMENHRDTAKSFFKYFSCSDWTLMRSEKFTADASKETLNRTKLIDEILEKIVNIKIHCLEQPVARRVKGVRRREIELVSKSLNFSSTIYLVDIALKAAIVVVVLGYFDNNSPTTQSNAAESLLVVMLYYLLIFHSMLKCWPTSLRKCREATFCMRNVQSIFSSSHDYSSITNSSDDSSTLLKFDVKRSQRVRNCPTAENLENFPSITVRNLMEKSSTEADEDERDSFELRCEHLKLSKGKKYLLVGASGVERRHFVQVLLCERHIDGGEVDIIGRRSFACQNPCVIKGSIRRNVVMAETYEEDKYKNIIQMCDLTKDEEALNGCEIDVFSSVTDECCVILKQKINLARCLYADAEIYIVEMPLLHDDNEIWNIIISNAMQKLAKVKRLGFCCRLWNSNELKILHH